MKLLVRNLSRSTTEEELQEKFETVGTVDTCTIVLDAKTGASKGFGFIEMSDEKDAKTALKTFDESLDLSSFIDLTDDLLYKAKHSDDNTIIY